MHHGEIVNLIKDSGYSVVLTVGPPVGKNFQNIFCCLPMRKYILIQFSSFRRYLKYSVNITTGKTNNFGAHALHVLIVLLQLSLN